MDKEMRKTKKHLTSESISFAKEYRLIKRQLKSEQSGLGLALFLCQ